MRVKQNNNKNLTYTLMVYTYSLYIQHVMITREISFADCVVWFSGWQLF